MAAYAPIGNRPSERDTFFEQLSSYMLEVRGVAAKFVLGDFNSHVGSDCSHPRCGPYKLRTPTSKHSQKFLDFLDDAGMYHVDSFLPCRSRGTWTHLRDARWLELDCVVTDLMPGVRSRFHQLQVHPLAFGDHYLKMVRVNLFGRLRPVQPSSVSHQQPVGCIASGFDGRPRPLRKLRLDALLGPPGLSQPGRALYSEATDHLLREHGDPSWTQLSELLVAAAHKHFGRAPRSRDLPVLQRLRFQESQLRDSLRESWRLVQEAAPEERLAKRREHAA